MGEAQCDRKVQSADAIVVGAGFAGLYMVHRLRSAGFSVLGLEAAGDVGGTWYWNRYPGARCDIPSLLYCYTWSEELRREWRWSEKYATQPEILANAEHVADRFGLRGAYRFHTRVTAAHFDEPTGEWLVQTDQGDRLGGPATYLGLTVAGFPNLFTITGPGSPSVLINVITAGEQHVDWVSDALVHMRQNGWRSMEPDPLAQEAWTSHVAAEADKTLYLRANSWYLGANVPGKPRVFMPYVGEDYKSLIDREASSDYPGFRFSKQ